MAKLQSEGHGCLPVPMSFCQLFKLSCSSNVPDAKSARAQKKNSPGWLGKRKIRRISFQGESRSLKALLGTEAKMLNWDSLSQLWTAGKSMNTRPKKLLSRYLFAAPGSSQWSTELIKYGPEKRIWDNMHKQHEEEPCWCWQKNRKSDWSCPTQSTASPRDLLHLRPGVHAWPLPGNSANYPGGLSPVLNRWWHHLMVGIMFAHSFTVGYSIPKFHGHTHNHQYIGIHFTHELPVANGDFSQALAKSAALLLCAARNAAPQENKWGRRAQEHWLKTWLNGAWKCQTQSWWLTWSSCSLLKLPWNGERQAHFSCAI